MPSNRTTVAAALVAAFLSATTGSVLAQSQSQPQLQPPSQSQPSNAPQTVRPADLMTQQERDAFRQKMQAAKTPEERQQIRDAQRATLEQRARDKGVTLAAPGTGEHRHGQQRADGRREVYNQLFTQEERDQFRNQMHAAQTPEARQKLREEHRTLAEARAKEKGITLPPAGSRGHHRPSAPAPAAS